MRKLPTFCEKVTDFLQETYRPSEIPLFYLSVYLPIARLGSLTIHKAFRKIVISFYSAPIMSIYNKKTRMYRKVVLSLNTFIFHSFYNNINKVENIPSTSNL